MNYLRHFCYLSFGAIGRNRVQTSLAVLGVMIGVGALVTSLALGRGAQDALQDQLLAAGVNMIVITAGNYQVERQQRGDGAPADHGMLDSPARKYPRQQLAGQGQSGTASWQLRPAVYYPEQARLEAMLLNLGLDPSLVMAHFEDDPMAVHDHPTAKERLGDTLAGLGSAATLTRYDAEAIRQQLPGIQFVAAGVHENARVTREDDTARQWFTRLHGTEASLPEIRRGWIFPYGRFINAAEVNNSAQVLVLGSVAAERLYGAGVDPVGERLLLWNQPFRIVGVVDSTSWAVQPSTGDDQFDAVYVPVSTVHRLLNLSKLNTITVTSSNAGDNTVLASAITDLLRARHGMTESIPDDFTVRTQAEQVLGKGLSPELARSIAGNMASMDQLTMNQLSASLQRANRTMLILLGGVAAISLLVGGIGVMNLLLLSVTQRTREVGLRMALGARRRDIAAQFVGEAAVISLVGGLLGLVLGVVAASGLEGVLQWSTSISPLSMVFALVVAAILGIISGVYPAHRASQLDPIGALQRE